MSGHWLLHRDWQGHFAVSRSCHAWMSFGLGDWHNAPQGLLAPGRAHFEYWFQDLMTQKAAATG